MKRIVVKVGSAVLTENTSIALKRMKNLVDFIVDLRKKYEVILVSSGAVAAGYTQVQLDRKIIANRQALAAIGQPILMDLYNKKFNEHNVIVAQLLVTSANFKTYIQYSHFADSIEALLKANVLPIINENDTTATHELIFGDNDQLSAEVATHTNSDLVVILSDIDAYYDNDPRSNKNANVLKYVNEITRVELEKDVTPNNEFATGGIVTKLQAADLLLQHNKSMFLSSGFNLTDVRSFMIENNHIGGTLFTKSDRIWK